MPVEITPMGLAVIPITLLLLTVRPSWLLILTIALAPFQGITVLNVYVKRYPIGILPSYFVGGMFLLSLAIGYLRQGTVKYPGVLRYIYAPLLAFTAYAVLSAILFPLVFRGVMVFPPREGILLSSLSPLEPSNTNYAQALYAIFLIVFAFFASCLIASKDDRFAYRAVRAYALSGFLVCLVGFYEMIAFSKGLPFPVGLYTNPLVGGAAFNQLAMFGIKRLTSTFTEASYAGCYLSGVFGFAYSYCRLVRASALMVSLAFMSFICLLLTLSTGAYLTLAIILMVSPVIQLVCKPDLRSVLAITSTTLAIVLPLVLFLYLTNSFGTVRVFMDAALFGKIGGISFQHRTGADIQSFSLIAETGGLGVGFGSTRPSSFVAALLANVGILGVSLLVWFAVRLHRLYRRAERKSRDTYLFAVLGCVAASLAAMLTNQAICVSDYSTFGTWACLSIFVGIAAKITMRDQQATQETAAAGDEGEDPAP